MKIVPQQVEQSLTAWLMMRLWGSLLGLIIPVAMLLKFKGDDADGWYVGVLLAVLLAHVVGMIEGRIVQKYSK